VRISFECCGEQFASEDQLQAVLGARTREGNIELHLYMGQEVVDHLMRFASRSLMLAALSEDPAIRERSMVLNASAENSKDSAET